MKKAGLVILIVILLVSSLLSASLLTRGHLWWDDFASYIMQAKSLLNGNTQEFIQHNTFTIQESSYPLGPIAYPWGYPFLLAPVLALFGLKVLALKLVSSLFYVLFLFVFYHLARLRLPLIWSLFLTAIFAFNPALLQAHDLILSDIPFLFFSTLALFLIEKFLQTYNTEPSMPAGAITGAVIFAAFATRTNGLLLLGALAVAQLLHFRSLQEVRKKLLTVLMPHVVFGLLALLQSLLLPNGQESYFTHYSMLTPRLLLDNALYYLSLPAEMFKDVPFGVLFSIILALFFIVELATSPRRNAVFLTYILLTLGLFISWPERQGLRFLFPILPLIVLIAAEGWQFATQKLAAERRPFAQWTGIGLAGTLIILSLFVSAQSGWINLRNGREINGPFDSVSAQMFEFVREQTPAGSVIIFFKPRAMRLLAGRDSFMTETCTDFGKGNYMVFHEKQGSNSQVAEPEACTNVTLSVVFNNQRFTIYKIAP